MGDPESVPDEIPGGEAGQSDPSLTSQTKKTKRKNQKASKAKMTDTETNGTSQDNGAAQVSATPSRTDSSNLQNQLRAVTKERSRLSTELAELKPLQAEVQQLRAKLAESDTRYQQDMHLVELGIKSDRARRAIRREYREEIAELAEDSRPGFSDFVTSLREDNFYGKLFEQQAPPVQNQQIEAAPAPTPQRKMVTDPNAGADQPKDPSRPFDEAAYRSIKSRKERLALARKYGLVK